MEEYVKSYQKVISCHIHRMIISAILALDYNLGLKQTKRYLLGDVSRTIIEMGLTSHPYFGVVQFIDRKVLDQILENLLELGFIELETVVRKDFEYQKFVVSGLGKDYIEHDYELSLFRDKGDFPHSLFQALVEIIVRFKKTTKTSFTVKNEALISICHALPENEEDYLKIDGIGPKFIEFFYEDFSEVIKNYKKSLLERKTYQQEQLSESW